MGSSIKPALALLTVVVLSGLLWSVTRPPPTDRRARAFNVAIASPELSAQEVDDHLDASDALKRELDRRGETNTAESVRRHLREIEVDEPAIQAFHSANAAFFGGRPIAECRDAIDGLLRIHRLRQDFDLEDPENGLTYP